MRYLLVACLAIWSWRPPPVAAQEKNDWPRQIDAPAAKVIIYQPQPETFKGNDLKGRAAVSVTGTGKSEPVFGAIWFTARVETDRDARMVSVLELKVDHVRFPESTPEQEQQLAALLESEIPKWELTSSLDRLLTSLEQAELEQKAAENLKNDPPKIIFVTYAAILIILDGEPQLRQIENSKLMRVVNTAFPIVFDPNSKMYYLFGSSVWFTTTDLINGAWSAMDNAPPEVTALFTTQEGKLPSPNPDSVKALSPTELKAAKIFVATSPTELIVAEGEPKYSPLAENELLYMSNTGSEVFLEIPTQNYYVLLSGRWFRSASLEKGPWTYVPPKELPACFAKISPASAKSNVLVHVPNTEQAEEAYLDAQVPQTSAVKRSAPKPEVVYDGDAKFEKIEGTEVAYAVNTGTQVLKIKDKYYVCDQAVWYVSNSPKGPWQVSDTRPQEVDTIPPSSSAYNTKYVYVYDSTPEVVYVGYTPAYMGCYPYHGTVVYGTGWYYPPWIGPVYYYPRPVTWGFHMHYNPWTGWGFGMSWSAGWFTFSYGWGGGWAGYHHGYHHGYYHGYRHGYAHGYWAGRHAGSSGGWFGPGGYRPGDIERGDLSDRPKAETRDNLYNRPENKARVADNSRIAGTRPSQVATGVQNNMYADRDGNVYQRTQDGWQKRDKGGWSSQDVTAGQAKERTPSAGTYDRSRASSGSGSLESDYQARQRGNARAGSYGSYRGGGGGMRRR
ncbi:MAG: carbohydrate-binding family V/XII [bacterium]